MDKSKWKTPSNDSLKSAYNNRGKYPDQDNRRYIYSELGNGKIWKVTDKSHKVRLLPVHPNDNINFYGLTVHIHTNVGVNGDQFLCLKRMKNTACPICEHQATLWDSEAEMAKDLYPQTRYLVWVVDLSVDKDKQAAQIWSCPRTAMDDILGVSYKKATDEILNLADIDDGIAIYFDREKKQNTNFSVYKNFQLDDKTIPAKDEWLEGIISFNEILDYSSYDEVRNAFLGIAEETSTKKTTTTSANTVVKTEDESVVEEEASLDVCNNYYLQSIDDLSRDELEALAVTVLVDDYEESEIEEMGIKKLRRLVKEAVDKKLEGSEKKIEVEEVEDPKEALKKKLKERIG